MEKIIQNNSWLDPSFMQMKTIQIAERFKLSGLPVTKCYDVPCTHCHTLHLISSIKSDDAINIISSSTRRNFPLAMILLSDMPLDQHITITNNYFLTQQLTRQELSSQWNSSTSAMVFATKEHSECTAIYFPQASRVF